MARVFSVKANFWFKTQLINQKIHHQLINHSHTQICWIIIEFVHVRAEKQQPCISLNNHNIARQYLIMSIICIHLFRTGFMENVYHEGDQLVVIHSHELHPPAMPRKCNLSCGCGGKGTKGWRGRGVSEERWCPELVSNLNNIAFNSNTIKLPSVTFE